jgi:hypothetical protein
MTKEGRKETLRAVLYVLSGIIISLVTFAFTFKHESNVDLEKTIIRIDNEKASRTELSVKCNEIITYIDKQDETMRNERLLQLESIRAEMNDIKQGQIRMEDKLDRALGLSYISRNKSK